jgi:hypothetical protein
VDAPFVLTVVVVGFPTVAASSPSARLAGFLVVVVGGGGGVVGVVLVGALVLVVAATGAVVVVVVVVVVVEEEDAEPQLKLPKLVIVSMLDLDDGDVVPLFRLAHTQAGLPLLAANADLAATVEPDRPEVVVPLHVLSEAVPNEKPEPQPRRQRGVNG